MKKYEENGYTKKEVFGDEYYDEENDEKYNRVQNKKMNKIKESKDNKNKFIINLNNLN